MKKFVNLTLFALASLFHVEAKDISNRIFLPYLGSGLVGSFVHGKAQQIKPVTYPSSIYAEPLNTEFLCQEKTCNISSAGGGASVEAGLKIRPIVKLIELDIYANAGFVYSLPVNIPNKTTLQDGRYLYKRPSLWSNNIFLLINAEVTLRLLGGIGVFGGVGTGLWFTNYNATLKDTFNDEKDSAASYSDALIHASADISYLSKDMEFILRFIMPLAPSVDHTSGNNGIVDYEEKATLKYYALSLNIRRFF
ncbi:hypothetical protein LS73_001925 [Helicobacter muridarum]|uniref:Outer membrane protein beta-barrel domain-containing protein n=1 Tax=Helicobacter muridarum TaxID=216 RepID=A0A099TYW8_9HELI|nr:hypothetical protein [Helicobacter muridarum]TLE01451.1 hypothetical protein LS73_001925 [Helicobacter muridarum]STQ85393.1 Uncharacterised protein [Helicobacter muridarum]